MNGTRSCEIASQSLSSEHRITIISWGTVIMKCCMRIRLCCGTEKHKLSSSEEEPEAKVGDRGSIEHHRWYSKHQYQAARNSTKEPLLLNNQYKISIIVIIILHTAIQPAHDGLPSKTAQSVVLDNAGSVHSRSGHNHCDGQVRCRL